MKEWYPTSTVLHRVTLDILGQCFGLFVDIRCITNNNPYAYMEDIVFTLTNLLIKTTTATIIVFINVQRNWSF